MAANVVVALAVLLFGPASVDARAGLTADELLLVTNRNVPAGGELARHYAERRGVPAGRILELDLPAGDEISLDEYEQRIAEPILAALRVADSGPNGNGSGASVRCIVTFYGVPYRIAPRPKDPATIAELQLMADHRRRAQAVVAKLADRAEALARRVEPSYRAKQGNLAPEARLGLAAQHAAERVPAVADSAERAAVEAEWERLWAEILKPIELSEPASPAPRAATTPAAAPLPVTPGGLNLGSAEARRALRAEVRKTGAVRYDQLLAVMTDFLSFDQTDAAVDSELAAVRWGPHGRVKWQGNPLHFTAGAARGPGMPVTTMVMRLDGPSPDVVRRAIDDAIAVESSASGLTGVVVLDSWAKPEKKPDGTPDAYGIYDESIRRLERLLATAAAGRLQLVFEATDQLVPENSQREVALYCGWYDPNRVVLPGTFARGAVGFHVASYTAVGLRGLGGGWWSPALLSAGASATLGPVSEPYLSAFPPADEFFPLLLTGELTLAEVYWKTTPMVSWKMLAIGDPLYRPYAANPVLRPEDLPERLRPALSDR